MAHGYIRTKDIQNLVVTTVKVNDLAVSTAKLDANAVSVDKLAAQLPRTLTFKYSFAADGGAQGAIELKDISGVAQTIPANAVIQNCYAEIETAPTSGGLAELALGIFGNDNAFMAALLYSDASLGLDKFKAVNAELPIKVSGAVVKVFLTVTIADLTAGVIYVYVEYVAGH